jgi:PAS domain S-box-containing protein
MTGMEGDPHDLATALLTASPDAVVVVDEEGIVQSASPAVAKLFGYQPEELVGEAVELLLPDTLRQSHARYRRSFSHQPVARSMGADLDLRGRRSDGSVFPVDVSLAPTMVDGKLRVGAFVRDATTRRGGETLLHHVSRISRAALAGEAPDTLFSLTAEGARDLLGDTTAWIAVLPAPNAAELIVAAASGNGADELLGSTVDATSSIAARAMAGSVPFTIEDMSCEPDVMPQARAAGLGPGLYVPMLAETGPVGALVVARGSNCRPFDPAELAAAEGFASAAAVVLALGRSRQSLDELKMMGEQDRIGRDLHDTVIQRLFALGMGLQGAERLAEGPVRERVTATVEGIDEVIKEIRETIFDLGHPGAMASPVRHELREVIAEATSVLGFAPRLALKGPVESEITPAVVPQMAAVVREALSNVARHAKASAVDVVVQASNGSVVLTVSDDGIGPSSTGSAGHGVENMATRAEQLGGTFSLRRRTPSGTLLTWTVPSGLSPLPAARPQA